MNPEYGTERCDHGCHRILYLGNWLRQTPLKHPHHCSACDGSRVITMAEAKARSLPQRASEQDFKDWLSGGKDLLDYCICPEYTRSCRFHNGGKTVTDGPHNLRPVLPDEIVFSDKITLDACDDPSCIFAGCLAAIDKEKTLSKSCGLTADDIRKQWEDEVLRTHGDLPDWKLAVIYAWLHNRGMRMDDTEKIIREGLRKEIASK